MFVHAWLIESLFKKVKERGKKFLTYDQIVFSLSQSSFN